MCKRHAWHFVNILSPESRLLILLSTITIVWILSTSAVEAAVLAALLAALVGLARRWRSLAGTTLRAPWYWMLAALAALAACELATLSGAHAGWTQHVRYLAAVATFCPLMAVLGAKRPQDRGWQFIVASLWIVAALPSVEQWFTRPHAALELHTAWRWFLLILIAIGLFNGLPTRYWASSLLTAAGQACLLSAHLPLSAGWQGGTADAATLWRLGAIAWCAAVALWGWDLPRRRGTRPPLDRLWLDFRDLVGAMWALRVADRINAASAQSGWSARLGWHGWTFDGEPPPALERSLRMLLRRFVSPQWIDRRLIEPGEPGA